MPETRSLMDTAKDQQIRFWPQWRTYLGCACTDPDPVTCTADCQPAPGSQCSCHHLRTEEEHDSLPPAVRLTAALQELASTYPTDDADPTGAFLQVVDPTGGKTPIRLQAGQVEWLTTLIRNEIATSRNAHPGESGRCAHCHGSGDAFTSVENSRELDDDEDLADEDDPHAGCFLPHIGADGEHYDCDGRPL